MSPSQVLNQPPSQGTIVTNVHPSPPPTPQSIRTTARAAHTVPPVFARPVTANALIGRAPPPSYQEAIRQPANIRLELARQRNFLKRAGQEIIKQHAIIKRQGEALARLEALELEREREREREAAEKSVAVESAGDSSMNDDSPEPIASDQSPSEAASSGPPSPRESPSHEPPSDGTPAGGSPSSSSSSDSSASASSPSNTRPYIIDRVFENIDEPGRSNYFVQTFTNGSPSAIIKVAVKDIYNYVSAAELEDFEMEFTRKKLEAQQERSLQTRRGRGRPRKAVSPFTNGVADMRNDEPNVEVSGESSRSGGNASRRPSSPSNASSGSRRTETNAFSGQSSTTSKPKRKIAPTPTSSSDNSNTTTKRRKSPNSTVKITVAAPEPEYEVEAIVGDTMIDDWAGGKVRIYEVKWKGWSAEDNTWQSIEELENSSELVREYMLEKRARKQRMADMEMADV